jgi:hypothetical protein
LMIEAHGEEESLATWACAAGSATREKSRAARSKDLLLCNAISLSGSVVESHRNLLMTRKAG